LQQRLIDSYLFYRDFRLQTVNESVDQAAYDDVSTRVMDFPYLLFSPVRDVCNTVYAGVKLSVATVQTKQCNLHPNIYLKSNNIIFENAGICQPNK